MWIKNIDTVDHTYVGQLIEDGTYYEVQPTEKDAFANSSDLIIDISNGKAQVSEVGADSGLISGVSNQINYLNAVKIMKTQTILTQDGMSLFPFGDHFTAAAGTYGAPVETIFDMDIPKTVMLRGAHLETESFTIFDHFYVEVVLLGTPDTVLNTFANKWQCQQSNVNQMFDESISDPLPDYLKIRIRYFNHGPEKKVTVTFRGYE